MSMVTSVACVDDIITSLLFPPCSCTEPEIFKVKALCEMELKLPKKLKITEGVVALSGIYLWHGIKAQH